MLGEGKASNANWCNWYTLTHTVHQVCKLRAIELERYRAALQGSDNKPTFFLYSYQQIRGSLAPGCPWLMPGPRLSSPAFGMLPCVWYESYAAGVLGVFLHAHPHESGCVSRCPCNPALFHTGYADQRNRQSEERGKKRQRPLISPHLSGTKWHSDLHDCTLTELSSYQSNTHIQCKLTCKYAN